LTLSIIQNSYKKLWKQPINESDAFQTFKENIPNNASIQNALNSLLHEIMPQLSHTIENTPSLKLVNLLEEIYQFCGEEGYFQINKASWEQLRPYVEFFKSN
jgi:hypothetical protein